MLLVILTERVLFPIILTDVCLIMGGADWIGKKSIVYCLLVPPNVATVVFTTNLFFIGDVIVQFTTDPLSTCQF